MNQPALFFDDVRTALVYKTNELGDRAFVAGNDPRRKHDRVGLFDGQAFVNLGRHLIERRARLSLRSRYQKNNFVIVQALRVVDRNQHSVMNIQITEALGDFDVFLH